MSNQNQKHTALAYTCKEKHYKIDKIWDVLKLEKRKNFDDFNKIVRFEK